MPGWLMWLQTKNGAMGGEAVWKDGLGCDESEVLAEHQGETSRPAGLGLRESKGQEGLGSGCHPKVFGQQCVGGCDLWL